jgi:hypothetical protein
MPTKADPKTLRRELTENRYRLTDYEVRQKHGTWWVTLCDEPDAPPGVASFIGPFASERAAWQGLEALIEPRKTV